MAFLCTHYKDTSVGDRGETVAVIKSARCWPANELSRQRTTRVQNLERELGSADNGGPFRQIASHLKSRLANRWSRTVAKFLIREGARGPALGVLANTNVTIFCLSLKGKGGFFIYLKAERPNEQALQQQVEKKRKTKRQTKINLALGLGLVNVWKKSKGDDIQQALKMQLPHQFARITRTTDTGSLGMN